MSEHKAREIRDARLSRERETAITERAGYLALVAALLRHDDIGSAIDTAADILDLARQRAERDVAKVL